MAEFNIHHDVNELMKLLEIEDNAGEGITAEFLSEMLRKSTEQKSKTRGAAATFVKKLEPSSDPQFKTSYEELKANK